MKINGKLLAKKSKKWGINIIKIENALEDYHLEWQEEIELDAEQTESLLKVIDAYQLISVMCVGLLSKIELVRFLKAKERCYGN